MMIRDVVNITSAKLLDRYSIKQSIFAQGTIAKKKHVFSKFVEKIRIGLTLYLILVYVSYQGREGAKKSKRNLFIGLNKELSLVLKNFRIRVTYFYNICKN